MGKQRDMLYASLGDRIIWAELDADHITLSRRGSLCLAANVQFAAMAPSGRILYVVVSDAGTGTTGAAGRVHGLQALSVDPGDGSVRPLGIMQILPERPIHLSIDGSGRYASVAFNKSGLLRLYALSQDGTVGAEIVQDQPIHAGTFTHQSIFMPDNKHLVAVARGNDPHDGKREEAGGLYTFDFSETNGQLRPSSQVGFPSGIGPRHLFLHPQQPWAYLAIERGSLLLMYQQKQGILAVKPMFSTETLKDPGNKTVPRQRGGVAVIDPQGKCLYVSNRADKTELHDGEEYLIGGENNLAVFVLDKVTGEPRFKQYISCYGAEARNLAIDSTGRLLIAANQKTMRIKDKDGWRQEQTNLALFTIAPDGSLDFVRRYEMGGRGKDMLWMGIYREGGADC